MSGDGGPLSSYGYDCNDTHKQKQKESKPALQLLGKERE